MNCGSAVRGSDQGKWTCRSTSIRTNTFSAWKKMKAGPISPRKSKCPNVTLEEIRQDYQAQRQGRTRGQPRGNQGRVVGYRRVAAYAGGGAGRRGGGVGSGYLP